MTNHWSLSVVASSANSTESAVTREDVKAWLRVPDDETADDALLDSLALSAEKRLEERWSRAFLVKTYDYTIDVQPCSTGFLKLPRSPLVSVASITSYDDDNTPTVWSTSEYRVDTASEPGRIVANDAYDWPDDLRAQGGIVVRFNAGYSTSPDGVPDGVKTAIKAVTARLYDNRGDTALNLDDVVAIWDDEYALPEVY